MQIEFRPYQAEHREAIINIFASNCPKYFHTSDLPDLIKFLDNYADNNFLVVKIKEKIYGCGGHYISQEKKIFGIAWVMFERNSLGFTYFKSISDNFYQEIIRRIKNENLDYEVEINTTQLMERLFSLYGFKTAKIIKDGFGKGLDHHIMRLQLK